MIWCVFIGDYDNRRIVGLIMVIFIFFGGFFGIGEDNSGLLISCDIEIKD